MLATLTNPCRCMRAASAALLCALLLGGCNTQRASESAPAISVTTAQPAAPAAAPETPMERLWRQWNDPQTQAVAPFQIFDNLYYVGMEWVAAYLLVTDAGLILIDSLYEPWTQRLLENIRTLGFDPAELKFVILTHGHFDHAGGAALLQSQFGARVVMSSEDWQLAAQPADDPRFAMTPPTADVVAGDGDIISLGRTRVTLLKTPGHTEGVLSLRYQVFDQGHPYEAITLGGVGRNFSGVERTESYIDSYERLLLSTTDVSVSLPNHAAVGRVFERAEKLATRAPGAPHPFVDSVSYREDLQSFLAAGRDKLERERSGNARSAAEELSDMLE